MRVDYVDEILPAPPEPVTNNPVVENFAAATSGTPLKAAPEQDHIAHIREHLRFIMDPMFGMIVAGPNLQLIMGNINEHLMLMYLGLVNEATMARMQNSGASGDLIVAEVAEQATAELHKALRNLPQLMQQANQMIAQKMPQPPVDPAVQKTFEAAMAKVKSDEGVAMKRLEQDAAMKQAEIAAEQQQQQFDNMLAQQQQGLDARFAEMGNVIKMQIVEIQEQGRREAEQLRQQVEIMKNDADNEQHQMTELLKNYQDNLTQMQIAMQKMRDDFSSGADLTPQVEQLNGMLMKVEQQRGQDALAAVTEGLRAVIETMNRPKTIIEDEQGRPVGTR